LNANSVDVGRDGKAVELNANSVSRVVFVDKDWVEYNAICSIIVSNRV